MRERERGIYDWAYRAGQEIIERLEALFGEDGAGKRMENALLVLRSELIPERFRRAIIDLLIETRSSTEIPDVVKVEKRWTTDEFYRYSTAILAGFFDALNRWRAGKKREGEEEKGEEGARR